MNLSNLQAYDPNPKRSFRFLSGTTVLLIAITNLLLTSCGLFNPAKVNVIELDKPIPSEGFILIEPSNSLFEVNIKTWNEAPSQERLANCAGFIRTGLKDPLLVDASDLNALAKDLFKCIDQSTYGMPTMSDDAVRDVLHACLYTMGFDEKLDSTALY